MSTFKAKYRSTFILLFFIAFPSLGHSINDDTLFIVGSTSMSKLIEVTQKPFYDKYDINIIVRPIGSDKGVVSVAEDLSNLGMISRYLTANEIQRWPQLQQITVGQDAIVLLVNKENKTNNLTKEELINLYTGKQKYWQENDHNSTVILMSKSIGHGTHSSFIDYLNIESMVTANKDAVVFKENGGNNLYSTKKAKSFHQINQAVAGVYRNKSAIAYESLGAYQRFIKEQAYAEVKLLSLDNQAPLTNKKVNSHYSFRRPLNILINGQHNAQTTQYINFLLSDEGQKIIFDNFFIPLNKH